LLKLVVLPNPPRFASAAAKNAADAQMLEDRKTVLVVTSGCGLYRMTDLAGRDPATQFGMTSDTTHAGFP